MNLQIVSFVLSLAALLLVIPLAVVANILTPTVKNWWASTSERRLSERIEKVKKELEREPDSLYVAVTKQMVRQYPITGVITLALAALFMLMYPISAPPGPIYKFLAKGLSALIQLLLIVTSFYSMLMDSSIKRDILDRMDLGEDAYVRKRRLLLEEEIRGLNEKRDRYRRVT